MNRYDQMRTFRIAAVVALCVVGGGIAGGLACSPSSQDGADQSKGGESARASSDWVSQVNEILQLRSSTVVTLDIDATPGVAASVNLTIAGGQYTLDLHPQSVRAANYQVKVQLADGSLVDAEPGPVRTLRGTVVGVEGSAVAASMEEDGLHARIFLSDDEQYWVEPLASRVPQAGPNHYVVYHDDDIIAPEKACGLDHLPDALGNRGALGTVRQTRAGACGTGLCVAELAADADYEYYQARGSSVAAVASRINSIINTVNVQFERDVNITHLITTIIVRSSEPDPYSSTDAVTLLNQFRNHWQSNQSGVQRDLAQLFTGKEINSNTIGVAWLNAVCGSYGYSMVQSDYNNNFSCATDLTAHELGHNWGAGHCNCTSHTMNPYITCANQFHPTLSIPEIVSFRDSRSCLEGESACTSDPDCDDGDACNGAETCDSQTGECNAGTPMTCDDGLVCTVDGCSNSTCTHVPVSCVDGDPCTDDTCEEPGGCVYVPIDPCCGDGVCDGGEACNSCAADCIGGGGAAVCNNGTCEPGEDCLSCPQDCNGKQNGKPSNRYCCSGDGAGGGTNPVGCGDGRCTTGGNQCGSVEPYCCGDGMCDAPEDETTCAVDCVVFCTANSECDDSVACTDDACEFGICVSTPNDANCPGDGLFCNGDEVCDAKAGCSSAGDPCPAGTSCNETTDACDQQQCGSNGATCTDDADCCSNKCKTGTCRGN